VHLFLTELNAKKLGLMRDLLPQVQAMAALLNPTSQNADPQSKELQAAGRALGLHIDIFNASSESEIDAAFTALAQQRLGALIVGNDPFFSVGANNWLHWQHATPSRWSMICASSPTRAD
jgi:putative ABC transport system substrate-binding protein